MSNSSPIVTANDIEKAAENIAGAIERTPTKHSRPLSALTGADVYVKFEIFQHTSAYKERGALNKLLTLPKDTKGVIAMSAGNHAQGVAYHASRLGIPATIVMPEPTPFNKVKKTENLGARVVLSGSGVEEAKKTALEIAEKEGLTFIHPFDDPAIIAGQGTVALEMLTDCPEIDTLIVPIGGGGLIAGMSTYVKAVRPDIRIIGVQSEAFPSMKNKIHGTEKTGTGVTIAEGIAVLTPGEKTSDIVNDYVDDILLVPESATESAIVTMMEQEKVVVEGAGAISLAALCEYPEAFKDRKVGIVLTGGNIDSRMLASAIMRSMSRDGRISRLRIGVMDTPGALAQVTQVVAQSGASVIEVRHQREFGAISLKMAELELIVETKDQEHADRLVKSLNNAGFPVQIVGGMH